MGYRLSIFKKLIVKDIFGQFYQINRCNLLRELIENI